MAIIFALRQSVLFFFAVLALLSIPVSATAAAGGGTPRRVVILNSYHQGFTWTDEQVAGILPVLRTLGPQLDVYVEYLDAKRLPGRQRQQLVRESLRQYVAGRPLDLLLTTDNLALDFALRERTALFPGVPIVFSGLNGFRPEVLAGMEPLSGVVEDVDPAGTLDIALRLQPQAHTVLAIFDGTESGRLAQEAARTAARRHADRRFLFLDDPTMAEVLQAVRRLPVGASCILLGNFNRDRSGAVFSHEEALAQIAAASQVPIYGLWDFLFGRGIVGGSLLSGRLQGAHAAELGLRFLRGEAAVPVETTCPTRLLFDHRQLQRFGLDAALLPPGSAVRHRPPAFYEEHRSLVIGTTAVAFGLGGVIVGMARVLRARKEVAAGLREQSHLLAGIISHIPHSVYWKDRFSVYQGCNDNFARRVGVGSPVAIVGKTDFDLPWKRDEAEAYRRQDRQIIESGVPQIDIEQPQTLADGRLKTMLMSKVPLRDERGAVVGVLALSYDVTERKNRERELEALAQLATALRAARSSDDMYRILLDCLLAVIKVNGALIVTRDAADGQAVVEIGVGVCAPLAGQKLAPELKPVRTLFDEKRPCQADGAMLGAIFAPLPAGMEHVACVPMLAHDSAIGAVGASRTEPFTAEELRLLGSLAEMGASAIHRCELHERTRLQLDRLSTLQSIDRAIIGSHDFTLTMETLLDQVVRQMCIDAAAILLCQTRSESLTFGAGRGFRSAQIRATCLQPGEGIAGRAVRERQLRFVSGREALIEQTSRRAMVEEEEFAFYCGLPLVARGELQGVLELFHRAPMQPAEDWLEFLEALGLQAAIALDNARLFADLQKSNRELLQAYDRTIEGWSQALDLRDRETEGHALRVTEMTVRLARAMGFAEADLVHVRHGALLHDIGKMGIPDQILLKAGPLTADEWEIMKTHPQLAYQLLSPIDYLRPALDIPYAHHEKWDGSGYPRGLAGAQIPLPARLFAIVDVWDALLSDRPYRPGWPEAEVRRYLRDQAGKHFDPRLVDIFLSLL